jgi:hypothetical protein
LVNCVRGFPAVEHSAPPRKAIIAQPETEECSRESAQSRQLTRETIQLLQPAPPRFGGKSETPHAEV